MEKIDGALQAIEWAKKTGHVDALVTSADPVAAMQYLTTYRRDKYRWATHVHFSQVFATESDAMDFVASFREIAEAANVKVDIYRRNGDWASDAHYWVSATPRGERVAMHS